MIFYKNIPNNTPVNPKIQDRSQICLLYTSTKEGRKNLEHFNKLQDMKKQLTVSPEKPTPGNILFLYVSKDYRRNGIGTGLLKQISIEKDTDYSIYMDQLDQRTFMESHGFVKKNEVSQMRELNKKRFRESVALYKKEPRCEIHS